MEIKNSLTTLQPGMYILRHSKENASPISVSKAPGSEFFCGKLEVLSNTKSHELVLRDGSDCIVLHIIDAPVSLLISAFLENPLISPPALRIDKIALDEKLSLSAYNQAATALATAATTTTTTPIVSTATTPTVTPTASKAIEIPAHGLSLIGHIELTGDRAVTEGLCLGDPTKNLRLEGFQLMWPDCPDGIDLAYNIAIEGIGAMPMVKTGTFCGSRGEAKRITEVTFALSGAKKNQFELQGTAYFSGGFQMPISSGMALSGPSGLEHLTALRLTVVAASKKNAKNPWDASAKTQVFKAKSTPKDVTVAEKKPVRRTAKSI